MPVFLGARSPSPSRGSATRGKMWGGDLFFKHLILSPGIGIWDPTSIHKHMLTLALKGKRNERSLSHMPLASLYPEELAPVTGQQCEASCWQVLPFLVSREMWGKVSHKERGVGFLSVTLAFFHVQLLQGPVSVYW